MPTKYTTVSIPHSLHERLEKLISKKTGFKSVSDYVTYVLREVVAMHETHEPAPEASQALPFRRVCTAMWEFRS